jgi:serine/threonine-protein kinase
VSLTRGARLGPYEVTAQIGVGGMGEVYRALDTNLERQVAIKILPDTFAHDPERLARFEREAKTLASLNHSNIAQIYGLEKADGMRALVMELVEGPTLAERIAQGPIPLDDALQIARQIAEALEAAHEQGVIHRDLKPANIKLRPDGVVKVLDFGLAKALAPVRAATDATASPTITSPAMMTGVGVLLGTAAYMSPEQARGKAVDKRGDIWAFGCVLYEMLTGRRAFEGDDVTVTLARVVEREPNMDALPLSVPTRVGQALRVCLRKDPKQRVTDIRDLRLVLDGAFETNGSTALQGVQILRRSRERAAWVVAIVSLIALLLVWAMTYGRSPAAPSRLSRLQIVPTGTQSLSLSGFEHDVAITPDGSRVVYIGNNGTQLFVRALDGLEPVSLARGELRAPFISPDGQWVGFIEGAQTIRKVSLNGGPPVTVFRSFSGGLRGASWMTDNSVIFGSLDPEVGLQRASAEGGEATPLTRPDRALGEQNHWWPEMLPNDRGVLFTITAQSGGLDSAQIALLDLGTGMRRVLLRGGSHARYVSSGHLVYVAAGTLRAIAFDLENLTTVGPSVSVVSQVTVTPFGAVEAGISTDGTLVYVPGEFPSGAMRALVWIDRQSGRERLPLAEHTYAYPRLSPDGVRVVVVSPDQDYDLWLADLPRATVTRATFSSAQDSFPIWAPDGKHILFVSARSGAQNIFRQAADGTGTTEQLTEGVSARNLSSISPDGTQLLFSENDASTGLDIMILTLDNNRHVTPLVRTPANERNGEISPDGRWLAYQSDESGQIEIYVRPFPAVESGRWQISTSGGTRPLWSRDGRELFYLSPTDSSLMRVVVERGATWTASTPGRVLDRAVPFISTYAGRSYDVSPDGQRFLMPDYVMPSNSSTGPASLVVVQHWFEELKRLVPTN